jgi:hypothetical protein
LGSRKDRADGYHLCDKELKLPLRNGGSQTFNLFPNKDKLPIIMRLHTEAKVIISWNQIAPSSEDSENFCNPTEPELR